jgi:serine/threonine protein kinase
MAEIFLARALSLAGFERHVVLKRILPERGDDPRFIDMFLDEARLAAQLQHPNIAQVFDLGRIGEAYFYTMEYVHGEDVRDILHRTAALDQRLPLDVALSIAVGTAAGLAHAHERCGTDGQPLHIVHRDVTPSNLMVSYEGVVKVLDFGIAKARVRSTETQAGTIVGKVAYMSPEAVTTGVVDARSDIFSLGIVLYEMLTHSRLFRRGNDYETLAAIARYDPPPPSEIAENVPPELDRVVMRALAKDPAQRFPTAATMLDALEAVADLAAIALSPRDVRKFMRALYGTRPEPWRELELRREPAPVTYPGDVLGPLTRTVFPADALAVDVPLLPQPHSRGDAAHDDLLPTPMIQKHHAEKLAKVRPPPPPRSSAQRAAVGAMSAAVAVTPPTPMMLGVPPMSAPYPGASTPPPFGGPGGSAPPETLMSVMPIGVRPMEVTHDVVPLPPPVRASAIVPTAPRTRSRAPVFVALFALVAIGVGTGAYALFVRGKKSEARRETPTVTPIEETAAGAATGTAAGTGSGTAAGTGSGTAAGSGTGTAAASGTGTAAASGTSSAAQPSPSAHPERSERSERSRRAPATGNAQPKTPGASIQIDAPADKKPAAKKPVDKKPVDKKGGCADPLDCQY